MPDQSDQIAGILAGLAVLLLTGGLVLGLERARWERRLSVFLGGPTGSVVQVPTVQPGAPTRTSSTQRVPYLLRLGASGLELQQAGISLTPRKFLAIQLLTIVLATLIARVFAVRTDTEGVWLWMAMLGGALVGLALPRQVLKFIRNRRFGKFERQFSIAIESIANALEAGLSLPHSIELMGRDMPAPLGVEFTRVGREMAFGLSLSEALDGMFARVPLTDVEIFVTAVHIQYRTGGNLSQILRTIAHTVRERLRIRGHIRTLTAQARLSSYVVSGLPFAMALLLRLINPTYFQGLLEPGAIRIAMITVIIGIGVGFYIMQRIADIEV
jgi:tight adherence protein B